MRPDKSKVPTEIGVSRQTLSCTGGFCVIVERENGSEMCVLER